MRRIPQMKREDIQRLLDENGITDSVLIVGVRGYYLNSMGKHGKNDRGIYDDAIFVIAPKMFLSFQANVDPSIFRKGIATLKAGRYSVVKHKHKGQYDGLQIISDVLTRDNHTGESIGRRGINFHYGGENQTWSEGCQTLPKSTYWGFLKLVYNLMETHGLKSIPYLLTENK